MSFLKQLEKEAMGVAPVAGVTFAAMYGSGELYKVAVQHVPHLAAMPEVIPAAVFGVGVLASTQKGVPGWMADGMMIGGLIEVGTLLANRFGLGKVLGAGVTAAQQPTTSGSGTGSTSGTGGSTSGTGQTGQTVTL